MVLEKTHQLILKNDNEHDYLYVIACLMRVCDHTAEQAEQCTLITHNVGECSIKTGDFLQMMQMQNDLTTLSLDVELEQYEGNLYK
jgi:ATP-dependent Clp protease adaptor protein ClpS